MAAKLERAKPVIEAYLNGISPPVFKHKWLTSVLAKYREQWDLPVSLSFNGFQNFLTENSKLSRHRVELPHRPETVFAWGEVSSYCMASVLKTGGYLSHYSAMHIHELTDQTPSVIYINHEQRVQPRPEGALVQHSVDRAFKSKQRLSKNVADFLSGQICLINGKNTNRLGVIELKDSNNDPVAVTDLHRTLIDIVVRPTYAGGIKEVAEAYKRAAGGVQVSKLIATLRKLDYKYPYHQSIGFLMDYTGAYPASRLDRLLEMRTDIKFYLAYGMENPKLSKKWNVWYPSWMQMDEFVD